MTNLGEDEFDGCNRACRKAGAHTREWGGCEHGVKPEPHLSVLRGPFTAADGYLSFGTETITLTELAELIEQALRTVTVGLSGGEYGAMALAAAKALIAEPDTKGIR